MIMHHTANGGRSTFPKHFHDGKEDNVKESNIPDDPSIAIDYFLAFVRGFLKKEATRLN
jgi:hypothetical protein